MIVRPATSADLAVLPQLLARGRRVYRSTGDEDLPSLVAGGAAGDAEAQGKLWGFVAIALEKRPATLPPAAADRAYLRVLVLTHGYPPGEAGVLLLSHTLVIVQRPDPWLVELLAASGFGLAEEVQTFRLESAAFAAAIARSGQVARHPVLELRPAHPTDLDAIALLDTLAFEPLWHFSSQNLVELLFASEMLVATQAGRIIGYIGMTVHGREAHLTRIAVHPDWQGQGVGKRLLAAAVQIAQSHHVRTLTLNTQVSNRRSQQLYRSFGFAPTGQPTAVYTHLVHTESLQPPDPSP